MIAFLLSLLQAGGAAAPREIAIEPQPQHLGVAALGEGGGNRLLAVTGRTLRLVEEPEARLALTGDSVLWTIADLDGDGRAEFLVLADGDALHRVERAEGADGRVRLRLSAPILAGLRALPPRGVHPAEFARDLDGDGRLDLLLPLGGRVRVLLGAPDGAFRPGPDLGALARLQLETGAGGALLDRVERLISIPGLAPADVSGDGLPDLVISEGLDVRQFISAGDGLPEQPTRTLDLSRFRLDPNALDLDLGNLTAVVRTLVVDEWQDLDNDGDEDLVVLGDGRVHSFLGGPQGVAAEQPVQSLKLSGNPFYVAAVRVDEDEWRDLVVIRVEDIGLGQILRAALFSWKIEFDFLVYRGEGDGTFDRRPLVDRTVVLEGDSLLAMADGERDRLDALRRVAVRAGDLDGDGRRDDLVTLDADGSLRAWRGVVPPGSPGGRAREEFLREALGSSRRELRWQVEDLATWVMGRTSALIALTRERAADSELVLPGWEPPHALALRDLDGDGRDEAIVLRRIAPADGAPARLVGFVVAL